MAAASKRSITGRATSVAKRIVGRGRSGDDAESAAAEKAPAAKTAKKSTAKKAPAKKTPAKKTPAKKTPATKTAAKRTPATKTAKTSETKRDVAKKSAAEKAPAKKAPAKEAPAKEAPAKKAPANKSTAKRTPAKKTPATKTAATKTAAPGSLPVLADEQPWTKAEVAEVREHLEADVARLAEELELVEEDLHDLMWDTSDGAGHDQADVGSSSFERDQEMTIVNNARDMLVQTKHALRRIDDGTYGRCEECGNAIGKRRLMAFPRATLCMTCKQREERR